jgi:UDP-glucuronate 4-epimerase
VKNPVSKFAFQVHNLQRYNAGLRFFTVYGAYGRPDMAYFSFANNIVRGKPIKIFQGPGGTELARDFTFIGDVVKGIVAGLDPG